MPVTPTVWLCFQIDYLQQKNADLQTQLDESLTRTRTAIQQSASLDNRNKELEGELQNVDRMAQRLQLDKQTVEKTADLEIRDTQVLTDRLTDKQTHHLQLDKHMGDKTADLEIRDTRVWTDRLTDRWGIKQGL